MSGVSEDGTAGLNRSFDKQLEILAGGTSLGKLLDSVTG